MIRDIRQDPRPGDVVQVHPPLGDTPPSPLTVVAVEKLGVRWHREGQGEIMTPWDTWQGKNQSGARVGRLLELVEEEAHE